MRTPDDVIRYAREKISLGRAYVLHRADYYSAVLLEMTLVVVDTPGVTMGVTKGLVLYVGGNWLLNDPEVRDDDAVGACLVHECEHPLRGLERLEALPNAELANVAGDIPINDNLRDEGWKLPSWCCHHESFGLPKNLTLEEYYSLLQQKMDKNKQTLQQYMDSTQQGTGTKDEKGQGSTWVPKVGSGGCGGVGGNAVQAQLEAELDAAYGRTQSEVESARRQTLDDIESAIASGCGNVPGRFQETLKLLRKKPDINWKAALSRRIQRSAQAIAGASTYSLSNPSVSGQLTGCITAGLIDRQVNLCIAEDTSYSMGAEQLLQARNEAFHLVRRSGVDTAVHLQVDTTVQQDRVIRLRDLPRLVYKGRGGTDFTTVFDYVRKKHPRVNLLVYFTDGDGRAPEKAPRGIEVIWCIVRTSCARKPANWGHIVVCDKSQSLLPPYGV